MSELECTTIKKLLGSIIIRFNQVIPKNIDNNNRPVFFFIQIIVVMNIAIQESC